MQLPSARGMLSAMQAPTIETPRVTLRAHRRSDLDALADMWSSPAVVKHIGGRVSTREESWARLLRYVGHWTLMGFGFWALEERASGRYCGELGIASFERTVVTPLSGTPEMGWALAPWAQGRGYATEALSAAIAWAELNVAALRTMCLIDAANVASMRVATKCGFREIHRANYFGDEETVVLERPLNVSRARRPTSP